MKLTHTTKRKAGMTLLELTVVILVLLSLISILFIGARAWKKGSDRAASILMIRNVQQAVRSYANMNSKNPGDAVAPDTDLFGDGKFLKSNPTATGFKHPAGTSYAYSYVAAGGAAIPAVGTLYINTTGTSSETGAEAAAYYNPSDTADW